MTSTSTTLTDALPLNARVSAFMPRDGRTMTGTVVGYDDDHYLAAEHGRAVHIVRWRSGGQGTGWRASDLQRV